MSRSVPLPKPSNLARHWSLDPNIVYLNHGSFGACPTRVLEAQQQWRQRMEAEPVQFFARDLEGLLDGARRELAGYLGCSADGLVFVPNATAGVNAVVRSMEFSPGDELLTTNHEYNACNNVLRHVASKTGARIVEAEVPFPCSGPDVVLEHICAAVSPRTKLALISHITSQSAMIFPIKNIVRLLESKGVPVLVDGAHAPGMVDLNISDIGAAFYTGNCHKWMCAPKGAGFLHVRKDWRERIVPASVSHGLNSQRTDRSKFLLLFDWTGTADPTAYLCVPEALRVMQSLAPGGWPKIRRHNHELVLAGRRTLCTALGIEPPAPESMIGSIASVPLPDSSGPAPTSALYADPLQDELKARFGIQIPIIPWPAHPKRVMRLSAQLYNTNAHYTWLASSLLQILSSSTTTAR